MSGSLETTILKGVSRSFYLTLRILPPAMRRAASLGYLLARTSDTVADTHAIPVDQRITLLDRYAHAIETGERMSFEAETNLKSSADPREAILLNHSPEIFAALHALPAAEAQLVRDVLATIISGQKFDLLRFAPATPDHPVCLTSAAELEDYTWRVAGCVGAFWTRLGFLTLGPCFSFASEPDLLQRGIAYGKGLQLVNILRDLPEDIAAGRCYLPIADPADRNTLLQAHQHWLELASSWVHEGEHYAATLPSRRLRVATVLPSWLATDTLDAIRGKSWEALRQRIRIPRSKVYRLLWDACFWKPGPLTNVRS